MSQSPDTSHNHADPLSQAALHLARGEYLEASTMARQVEDSAQRAGDATAQGLAGSLLAQVAVIESRFKDATTHLESALSAFRSAQARDRMTEVLAMQAYVLSCMGQDTEALERGFRAASLSELAPAPAVKVRARNYLGVALLWAGHFERADEVLDMAIWESGNAQDVGLGFQPHVNRTCCEMQRQLTRAYAEGATEEPERLLGLLAAGQHLAHSGQGLTMGAGTSPISLILLDSSSSVASSWAGDLDSARTFRDACVERAAQLPARSWTRCMGQLAQCVVARAEGDVVAALRHAQSMVQQAVSCAHVPLQASGLRLTARLLEQLGQYPQAIAARRSVEQLYLGALGSALVVAEQAADTALRMDLQSATLQ